MPVVFPEVFFTIANEEFVGMPLRVSEDRGRA